LHAVVHAIGYCFALRQKGSAALSESSLARYMSGEISANLRAKISDINQKSFQI